MASNLYIDEDFLFVEKYRPRTIDDCILPDRIKNTFNDFVQRGDFPSLLLAGTAGTGKTTVAKALCNELEADVLMINASLNRNIDTLRNEISLFASTVSFNSNKKVVILDEADNLNHVVQPALRGFIEEFSSNCTFIFTCNYKTKIIEPIHSRTSVIEFNVSNEERNALMGSFMKRVKFILDTENVTYEDKTIGMLIKKHYPDLRRVLNELQNYAISGKVDSSVLTSVKNKNIESLIDNIKEKNFKGVREWLAKNNGIDFTVIYSKLYEDLYSSLVPNTIPDVIEVLAEYDYRNAFVTNQEISFLAAVVNIMSVAMFKDD